MSFSPNTCKCSKAAGVIHPVESDIDADSKTVSDDFMIVLPAYMALKQRKHYGNRIDTNDGGRR